MGTQLSIVTFGCMIALRLCTAGKQQRLILQITFEMRHLAKRKTFSGQCLLFSSRWLLFKCSADDLIDGTNPDTPALHQSWVNSVMAGRAGLQRL